MVISGRSVETFEEANFAVARRFYDDGEWRSVSTNHNWEVFWTELTAYDGETVQLAKAEGEFEIRGGDPVEFVELEQDHSGLFLSGTYRTRLRPYIEESRTERKPWNPDEGDA